MSENLNNEQSKIYFSMIERWLLDDHMFLEMNGEDFTEDKLPNHSHFPCSECVHTYGKDKKPEGNEIYSMPWCPYYQMGGEFKPIDKAIRNPRLTSIQICPHFEEKGMKGNMSASIKKYIGIGAIIGDIVGSPYEFDRNKGKTDNFPLFSEKSYVTDDSIMTLAVAKAFAETMGQDEDIIRKALIENMADFGKTYPHAGYGVKFASWIYNQRPYGSYGNGSAMRVSSVGWLFNSLEDVMNNAKLSAEISHNHPEGIKGAQATACAIYLTRNGMSKPELKKYIVDP